jgi:hypothetical protein
VAAGLCAAIPRTGSTGEPLHAVLATAESEIAVEAGEHAPYVTALTLRGTSGETWRNRQAEALPGQVEIDGVTQAVAWHLDRRASRTERDRIQLVYESAVPRLRLTWEWRARAAQGPLEHGIFISNLGDRSVWLPLLASFRFDFPLAARQPLRRFWVEKGADAPSSAGTHYDPFGVGTQWLGTSSTYARPFPNQAREMIPYVLVEQATGQHAGWYLGIEFSGRTAISLERTADGVRGVAGLNGDPGPYRTRLSAGETFATPAVFLGAARGGPDGAGNVLRRWVREVLNNPRTVRDPGYPVLVNNSWGSGMAVDDTLARRMILESKELGLEMFHLDAGWFRGVGDWHPDPAKFPDGVAAVADFAHEQGLKFGLWVDWTQAGTSANAGALSVHDPATRDWLTADPPVGWKHGEEYKGITIDIGLPAARDWAAAELERIVGEYHLDMLEHDGYLVAQGSTRSTHPAAPPDPARTRVYEDAGFLWATADNDTDVSYHATRAYYAIYERLRQRHPGLIFEICNDGGRMVDFGSAAHGDYFSITDIYDPLSNRRAFHDTSFVLPPAMLESYVERWPTPGLAQLRYMLRSGMMGWFSLMLDSSQWSAEQHAAARAEIALYKARLRPLIRSADLYHVGERPDGVHWDGIEYFDAGRGVGVLYAFRGSSPDEPAHHFVLQGLEPEQHYRLTFNDQGPATARVESGRTLLHRGVAVSLPEPLSSELVFIEAVHGQGRGKGSWQ